MGSECCCYLMKLNLCSHEYICVVKDCTTSHYKFNNYTTTVLLLRYQLVESNDFTFHINRGGLLHTAPHMIGRGDIQTQVVCDTFSFSHDRKTTREKDVSFFGIMIDKEEKKQPCEYSVHRMNPLVLLFVTVLIR